MAFLSILCIEYLTLLTLHIRVLYSFAWCHQPLSDDNYGHHQIHEC